jgi:hypothetical protein
VLFASVAQALLRDVEALAPTTGIAQPSNSGLYFALTQGSIEDLRKLVRDTPGARFLDPDAGEMPTNLIATVTSRVQAWSLFPDLKEDEHSSSGEPFSIRAFIEEAAPDDDAWLFLSADEAHATILKPLVSLWADIAAASVLSLPTSPEVQMWCVLDEVASLQRLPALPGLLERGRKHGAAVVLGLQAMPQLREAYGADQAAALAAQPQTWLVLRSVEPDTARWLERALGDAEVEEVEESLSMGAHSERDGVSLQRRTVRRPIALATEIASLPDFHGYIRLPGTGEVHAVAYQSLARTPIAKPFVPRGSKTTRSAAPTVPVR